MSAPLRFLKPYSPTTEGIPLHKHTVVDDTLITSRGTATCGWRRFVLIEFGMATRQRTDSFNGQQALGLRRKRNTRTVVSL
jgi:hypothetical protein